MITQRPRWRRAGRMVVDLALRWWITEVLAVIGGLLVAFAPQFDEIYVKWHGRVLRPIFGLRVEVEVLMVAVGALLAAAGLLTLSRERHQLEDDKARLEADKVTLKAEVADSRELARRLDEQLGGALLAITDLGDAPMLRLANALDLGVDDRASFIQCDGDQLRLVGRHAKDPRFAGRGRGIYGPTQGCIAKALAAGSHGRRDLPNPSTNLAAYRKISRSEYKMLKKDVDALTMLSRSYAAVRLDDPIKGTPIGIVVIESLNARGVRLSALEAYMNDERRHELSQALRILELVPVGADVATKKGF